MLIQLYDNYNKKCCFVKIYSLFAFVLSRHLGVEEFLQKFTQRFGIFVAENLTIGKINGTDSLVDIAFSL